MAAYLLLEQGYHVFGVHFITGFETQPPIPEKDLSAADTASKIFDGIKIRASNIIDHIVTQLGIDVRLFDCSEQFKRTVVDYFTQTYRNGKTPNPCMVCNPSIKFGTILEFARQQGASHLATGHYARTRKNSQGRFHLLKGVDEAKDQSYFLALLNQKKLSKACFPLGKKTKTEVVELAEKKGLTPAAMKESQDLCFVKSQSYGEFLAYQEGFNSQPGIIEDVKGNILGKHKGLHLFTIGQRRGINIPASEPYYVVGMDRKQNRLKVGFKEDLLAWQCKVTNINWINPKPTAPINVHTRVRYRHKAAAAKLTLVDDHTATVHFERPQSAITPGQCAVFYQDDEVLGGGWIDTDI
jgi:tRNA-specific 2-thiouridylase